MVLKLGQVQRSNFERTLGLPSGEIAGFWGQGARFAKDRIDEVDELLPLGGWPPSEQGRPAAIQAEGVSSSFLATS